MVMTRFQSYRMAAVRSLPAAIVLLVTATPTAGHAGERPLPTADSDLRLAAISYRIATQNADRCRAPDLLTGMLIHDLGSYDASDRALVAVHYGLAEGFGVRDLVTGSSADRAGIRRGDEIVGLNGIPMESFERGMIGRKASDQRSTAFEAALERALRQGPASIRLRRNNAIRTVQLVADKGCGGRPVVIPANDFNAWSDGRYVAVTGRLMREVGDDAELAFVVAHEMSHNILQHREQLQGRSGLLAQFGMGSGRVKVTEIEADTLAIGLLAQAGYDLDAPARFLTYAAHKRPFDVAITHPGLKRRIGIVSAEIARLKNYPSNGAKIAAWTAASDGKLVASRTADTGSQTTSAGRTPTTD